MLISDVKLLSREGYCELQAQIKSDALNEPFLLQYRFPMEFKRFINPESGNSFLAALLLPAMRAGEPLEIRAPVSPKLLRSIDEIQAIYKCWDPTLTKVVIKAPLRKRPFPLFRHPSQIGLFFSLGVDSFYSLLKNVKHHPDDDESITHLIVVHGFDIYFGKWNSELYPTVLSNSTKVAQELGKKVLPVATNIRDFSDRFADWGPLYHGAAMASVGLLLEQVLEKVYVAATYTYAQLHPHGSHLILDPLWSTEHLSFVHDGCEANRLDKMRLIAKYPIVLDTLRVCFMNPNNEYNCGCCEKCLRTMVALHIVGALQTCKTLPHTIDPDLLRNITIHSTVDHLTHLVKALGTTGTDLGIREALEECLSRRRRSGET